MIGSLLARPMRALHRPIYACRQRVLAEIVAKHLPANGRLLDVGCGSGTLAAAIINNPNCAPGARATGLERAARGDEPIEVVAYNGGEFPFASRSFDVVLIADVLHHEQDESGLLRECARVSRSVVIVKDHAREGIAAQSRISLMDWAANRPYGIPCLYRYHTLAEWRAFAAHCGLEVMSEIHPMNLYPPLWQQLFGGRLQYLAVLRPRLSVGAPDGISPPSDGLSSAE